MRNRIALMIFVCFLVCCSSHQTQTQPKTDGPRLTLTAYPRQGFAPMRVSINAKLDGISQTDKEFYCLQEEWEFGDGAVSSEQPNCDTFGTGSEIKTNFFAEHVYEEKGNYTIWFTLGDKKIKSNQLGVVVLESDITPNTGR